MGKQWKSRGMIALLTVALVVSTVTFPQMVFAQAIEGATSHTVHAPKEAQPSVASNEIIQSLADNKSGGTINTAGTIRQGYGTTDPDAGIFITSHTPESLVTHTVGYQLTVEAECQDYSGYGQYAAFFGLWDEVAQKYVQYFNSDLISSTSELWYAIFDLSSLAAANNRYMIDVVLYDDVTGEMEAYDYFSLNVINFSTAVISSITPTGPHNVNVNIKSGNDDVAYRVYKATSATGTYTYLGSTASSSYNCSGLTSGKTYYFKIRPYCSGGATTKYGSVSAYVSGAARPVAPKVSIPSIAYTSQKLSWSAVSGGNGYYVYRATSSSGTYSYIGKTTGTSFLSTGLTTGKTYYYKVKAYHTESNGTKVYSYSSSVKSAKAVPGKPTCKLALASQNSIKLTWNAVSGAHGYDIFRALTPGFTYDTPLSKIASVGSTTLTYTNSSLTANSNYCYLVRAYHLENGVKIYSPTPMETGQFPPEHATLGTPVITAYSSYDSIYVEWPVLIGATHYEVAYYSEANPDKGYVYYQTLEGSYSNNFYFYVGPSNKYTFRIRAYHMEGTTKVYATAGYSTPTYVAPMQPSTLNAEAMSPTSVHITWTGAYTSTGYLLERSTDNVNFTLISNQSASSPLEYTDTTCEPGATYYYRVAGYNQKAGYPGMYRQSDAITTPIE